MKIATVIFQGSQFVGRVADNSIFLYRGEQSYNNVLDIIDAGQQGLQDLADLSDAKCIPLSEVELLAPIPRPRSNIMCIGLNYLEHVHENTKILGKLVDPPEVPIVFTKAPSTVNAPYGNIILDNQVTQKLDWEVELGVVIGLGGKKINAENAMQHVFGYTVLNDVTARDLQRQHKQFFIGKSLDGACPMGPVVVTREEIGDPHNLSISSRVNGETQQSSNTRHMIFNIPTLIEILSRSRTLEAGDIIATGTPSGVGVAQTPPRFLKNGDNLESEIEHIGILKNSIVSA